MEKDNQEICVQYPALAMLATDCGEVVCSTVNCVAFRRNTGGIIGKTMKQQICAFTVMNKDAAQEYVRGTITMSPWISYAEWDAGMAEYPIPEEKQGAIENLTQQKFFLDYADRYTKILCFGSATYDEETGCLSPIDPRWQIEGDTVVVILRPKEFAARLANVVNQIKPDYIFLEAGEVHYRGQQEGEEKRDKLPTIESCNLYEESENKKWQKEIRLCARMTNKVRVGDNRDSLQEYLKIDIGDISDITRIVPMEEVIEQDIPPCTNAVKDRTLYITGGFMGLAGDFLEIEPKQHWLDLLRPVFPEGEWSAITFVETIETDKYPRLSYTHKEKKVIITFLTNRVELNWFQIPSENTEDTAVTLLGKLMDFLKAQGMTGFACLDQRYRAEIEMTEQEQNSRKGYSGQIAIHQDDLDYFHELRKIGKLRENLFGMGEQIPCWQYAIRITTPQNDKVRWYTPDDVVLFMEQTRKKAFENMSKMQEGDVYERFHHL